MRRHYYRGRLFNPGLIYLSDCILYERMPVKHSDKDRIPAFFFIQQLLKRLCLRLCDFQKRGTSAYQAVSPFRVLYEGGRNRPSLKNIFYELFHVFNGIRPAEREKDYGCFAAVFPHLSLSPA